MPLRYGNSVAKGHYIIFVLRLEILRAGTGVVTIKGSQGGFFATSPMHDKHIVVQIFLKNTDMIVCVGESKQNQILAEGCIPRLDT